MAKSVKGLSGTQSMVIDLLLTGKTDTEAARIAGCHRFSIARWRAHDPLFISEYKRRINELNRKAIEPYSIKLKELVDISLDTVSNAIRRGDSVTARWLLDKLTAFPEIISQKFDESTQAKEEMPTDIDSIIDDIADKQLAQIIKEEGLTEIDMVARHDFLQKLKQDLAKELKHNYQTSIERSNSGRQEYGHEGSSEERSAKAKRTEQAY